MDNQRDNLLYIAEYYGMDNQLEYLMSELRELIEAVIEAECYEANTTDSLGKRNANINKYRDHIGEEITDNEVLLGQIAVVHDIEIAPASECKKITNVNKWLDEYCRTIYKVYREVIEYWSDEYYYYEPVEAQHKAKISKYWNEAIDMLIDLELYYGIKAEFMDKMFDFKVNRQIERIRKEEEENE